MESTIDENIMVYNTMETFTKFDTSLEAEIIVDVIIAGTIIEIDIPSTVASDAIVADNGRGHGIKLTSCGHSLTIESMVCRFGCQYLSLPHEIEDPWSPVSFTVSKRSLYSMTWPPQVPSDTLMAARGTS